MPCAGTACSPTARWACTASSRAARRPMSSCGRVLRRARTPPRSAGGRRRWPARRGGPRERDMPLVQGTGRRPRRRRDRARGIRRRAHPLRLQGVREALRHHPVRRPPRRRRRAAPVHGRGSQSRHGAKGAPYLEPGGSGIRPPRPAAALVLPSRPCSGHRPGRGRRPPHLFPPPGGTTAGGEGLSSGPAFRPLCGGGRRALWRRYL